MLHFVKFHSFQGELTMSSRIYWVPRTLRIAIESKFRWRFAIAGEKRETTENNQKSVSQEKRKSRWKVGARHGKSHARDGDTRTVKKAHLTQPPARHLALTGVKWKRFVVCEKEAFRVKLDLRVAQPAQSRSPTISRLQKRRKSQTKVHLCSRFLSTRKPNEIDDRALFISPLSVECTHKTKDVFRACPQRTAIEGPGTGSVPRRAPDGMIVAFPLPVDCLHNLSPAAVCTMWWFNEPASLAYFVLFPPKSRRYHCGCWM